MDNQIIMENYLLVLKSTVEVFVHGTLESSNKDIHDELKNGLDEIMASQENTYNEMTKYGWYQVNNVDSSTINQTYMKLQNKN